MNYYIAISKDGSKIASTPYCRTFEISEKLHAEIAETVIDQVQRGKAKMLWGLYLYAHDVKNESKLHMKITVVHYYQQESNMNVTIYYVQKPNSYTTRMFHLMDGA